MAPSPMTHLFLYRNEIGFSISNHDKPIPVNGVAGAFGFTGPDGKAGALFEELIGGWRWPAARCIFTVQVHLSGGVRDEEEVGGTRNPLDAGNFGLFYDSLSIWKENYFKILK